MRVSSTCTFAPSSSSFSFFECLGMKWLVVQLDSSFECRARLFCFRWRFSLSMLGCSIEIGLILRLGIFLEARAKADGLILRGCNKYSQAGTSDGSSDGGPGNIQVSPRLLGRVGSPWTPRPAPPRPHQPSHSQLSLTPTSIPRFSPTSIRSHDPKINFRFLVLIISE